MAQDHEWYDFLNTLGREFADALQECRDEITGHDGYEVFSEVLGKRFTSLTLRGLSDEDISKLAAAANAYLEIDQVTASHIRTVVANTTWHWPPGETGEE
jgi:hypothetical protein